MNPFVVLSRVEKKLTSAPSADVQVQCILELTSLVNSQQDMFPDAVHGALRLLALLFFDADNMMRATIVESLRLVGSFDLVQNYKDDLLVPIIRVLDSNDPVARGLSLQALGYLSSLIKSHHIAHFRILDCLEAANGLESRHALFCAKKLCEQSPSFSSSMLHRASKLLSDSKVLSSDRFRLGLLSVLGSVASQHGMQEEARALLLAAFQRDPREEFVAVCLRSLTHICVQSFRFEDEHAPLLWHHFASDPRPRIRLECIRSLFALSSALPHRRDVLRIDWVIGHIASETDPTIQAGLLALLWSILRGPFVVDVSPVMTLLQKSKDARVVKWSLRALGAAAQWDSKVSQWLATHLQAVMKQRSLQPTDLDRKSAFLKACLALCSNRVLQHAPELGPAVLLSLSELSMDYCTNGNKLFNLDQCQMLLHALSFGIAEVCSSRRVDCSQFHDRLASLALKLAESGLAKAASCFTAVAIAFVQSLSMNTFGSWEKMAFPVRLAVALCGNVPEWRVACWKIACEAVHVGFHQLAAGLWGSLSQFPTSDRLRKWFAFLVEASRAEVETQHGRFAEASYTLRKALILLSAAGPHIIEQSSSQSAVQAVSRTGSMRFQKAFIKWRLAVLETPLQTVESWNGLAREALSMSRMLPDMDVHSRSFLTDSSLCCQMLAGQPITTDNSSSVDNSSVVARLRMSLVRNGSVSRKDIHEALNFALSAWPLYFFNVEPSISVKLSIVKPKISADLSEAHITSSSDTGHVVIVDGVIRRDADLTFPQFQEVELEVSVYRSVEKTSVTSRLLACGRQSDASLISSQVYRSKKILGDAFSVLTLCQFPEPPKSQHVMLFRVTLIDETGTRWQDVALETVTFASFIAQ